MKFLAAILSIYLLGLTFVPCEDAVYDQEDQSEFHVDNSSLSSSCVDYCSPFCQCHCCHVHVSQFINSETALITPKISNLILDKNYDLGEEIPNSFFQPPRV